MRADVEAICAQLPAYLQDPIRFLYLTGWRAGEMKSLEWRDVDLEGGTIRLRGENSKNKRGRAIPFDAIPELKALIERADNARTVETPLVFFRTKGKRSRAISKVEPIANYRKAWANACKAAGMAGKLVHDLRRSAVRNLTRAGVPRQIGMAVTGHRTESVWNRYDIRTADDIRAGMERLGEYLEAQPKKANVRVLSAMPQQKEPKPNKAG